MKILTILTAVLLFLTSCTEVEPDGGAYYTFTDDCGVTVSLAEKPEKTAVLFSSYAEIWTLAGGDVEITVGEAVERGFAPDGVTLADEGAGKTVNIETLIAAEPDFVIASADIEAQADAAQLLNNAGIPCASFRVESFGDYLRMLEICCDITGNADAYETYGTSVQAEIDEVLASVREKAEKRILFIRAGSSVRSTKAKTADQHFAAAMLEELGAYNIADNAPVLIDGLSMEEIMTENPDAVFITTMGDESAAVGYMNTQLDSPEWQTLDAVKSGRVYYLPKALFQFKPNHRWADAYRMLTELLYEN
ncbi:MAG: ABC transporter substrate-binding protein [Clostridia bacterium]|nr:ABC transporter substrate-binding protein [Clostridia bacterium]